MTRHERFVKVEGPRNVGDLGGYVTSDGQSEVRYGLLFRSDDPSCATREGRRTIVNVMKVKYSVDLRASAEIRRAPYNISGVTRVAVPINSCNSLDKEQLGGTLDRKTAVEMVMKVASRILLDYEAEFRAFFDLLLTTVKGRVAVLFHCTAGKDRTGLVAALLLTVLGVPRETIIEDFLLTNKNLDLPPNATCTVDHCVISAEALQELAHAQVYFLETAFHAVEAECGSVDAYLTDRLGLDAEKRRQLRGYYTRRTHTACLLH